MLIIFCSTHCAIVVLRNGFIYGTWPVDDKSPLETQEHVLPFLRGCASLAPTFVSLGNHEQMLDDADLETIRQTGVTLLDNNFTIVNIHTGDGAAQRLVIAGLTSAYATDYRRAVAALTAPERGRERYPRKESIEGLEGLRTASERVPDISWLDSFAAVPGFHVTLSHHPEYYPLIPESVNLVLSGHTHSGQVRYYSFKRHCWTGLFAPGQGWFPKYSNGVYDDRLIVSAGLSNTTWIPRINNPTEIVYITQR